MNYVNTNGSSSSERLSEIPLQSVQVGFDYTAKCLCFRTIHAVIITIGIDETCKSCGSHSCSRKYLLKKVRSEQKDFAGLRLNA